MRSVVQLYPGPPFHCGAVAQLGERLVCNQEATGSIPVSSTKTMALLSGKTRFMILWGITVGGSVPWILYLAFTKQASWWDVVILIPIYGLLFYFLYKAFWPRVPND